MMKSTVEPADEGERQDQNRDPIPARVAPLSQQYEWIAASVIGREHRRLSRNNQDAFLVQSDENHLIAVVCDGCGSGSDSEVGAKLGVRWVVNAIEQSLQTGVLDWDRIQQQVLDALGGMLQGVGLPEGQAIHSYGLFTVVGCVLTGSGATLFSLGDGVLIPNGQVIPLGPYPDNAPPYLTYALLGEAVTFEIQPIIPLTQLKTLLIGTDGVLDLIEIADHPLPGQQECVGSVAQFWRQDRYFRNPDQLRRRLSLINREMTQADWTERTLHREPGLLPDDTTLIVIRRGEP